MGILDEYVKNKTKSKTNHMPELKSVRTADNKEMDGESVLAIMLSLANCSYDDIKEIDMEKFFLRLATNFIKSNTEEDLNEYMEHVLIITIMEDLLS